MNWLSLKPTCFVELLLSPVLKVFLSSLLVIGRGLALAGPRQFFIGFAHNKTGE